MFETVWFVIPANRETAFRAVYLTEKVRGRDNPTEDEKVGVMVIGKAGNLMTGTTRMSDAVRRVLDGRKPPWLQVFTTFPPPSVWELEPIRGIPG